eukprot:COSAG01_NODE_411_length_17360_cov_11.401852_17_plen_246_part_00
MDYWWNKFRVQFKQTVPTLHLYNKLPIRPAHLEAIALDCNLSCDRDLHDLAAYYMLFFAGVRVAHVALTAGATNHAVCMEDLHFSPSLDNPTRVYVCFRSTKTRPRAANTPFWQALDAQPQLRWCPVALLRMHFMRAYRGQPSAPLFCAARDPRTPWPRSTFTGSLRRRLERASRHLDIPVDLQLFSGISFRKGSLSTLGAAGVPSHRLADHGDHASVQSSRRYTLDSLSQRAANSGIIAAAFRL